MDFKLYLQGNISLFQQQSSQPSKEIFKVIWKKKSEAIYEGSLLIQEPLWAHTTDTAIYLNSFICLLVSEVQTKNIYTNKNIESSCEQCKDSLSLGNLQTGRSLYPSQ